MLRMLPVCSSHARQSRLPACLRQRFQTQEQRASSDITRPTIRTRHDATHALIKRANHTEARSSGQAKARPVIPPKPVDVELIAARYSETTQARVSMLDPLLMSYQARGIGAFKRPAGAGNLHTALDAILEADNVMLCTGFNVDLDNKQKKPMPETDGPLGTAILAYAIHRTGKSVVVVADAHNNHLVREALYLLDRFCARQVKFETVSVQNEASLQQIQAILDNHSPDALVHTEVPGRNEMGDYLNMRGLPIGGFNAPLDELMSLANGIPGMHTVGIGDGGNEAGMGGLAGVPPAANGEKMQAVVQAENQIIAWNSNLGAIALAELVLAATGKPRSCSAAQLGQIIEKTLKEGAVDGVSRGSVANAMMEHPDYPPRHVYTGVDGFPTWVHQGNLIQLQDIVHGVKLDWPEVRGALPKREVPGRNETGHYLNMDYLNMHGVPIASFHAPDKPMNPANAASLALATNAGDADMQK